jgi:quercetin dioxygenase-like cupin family protein
MERAQPVLRLETDIVRVTEWRFKPGASTGHHRHDYDYVIVPLTDGTLRVVTEQGESIALLQPGGSYMRKAGVEHDVFNAGAEPLAFVEVELLDRPG